MGDLIAQSQYDFCTPLSRQLLDGAPSVHAHDLAEFDHPLAQAVVELAEVHTLLAVALCNSSPGDLAPVFNAILVKALQLCEAAIGIFVAFDGTHFQAVAHCGVPDALVEQLRAPQSPTPGGVLAPLVQGETIVQLADIADDDTCLRRSEGGEPTGMMPAYSSTVPHQPGK